MSINGVKIDLDYKNLYFVLKEKYDKLKIEIDELKLENKNKENELNKLRKKINFLNCFKFKKNASKFNWLNKSIFAE